MRPPTTQHLSTDEMRRRAPFHYWQRADNARFAARILSTRPEQISATEAAPVDYDGAPSIALLEAFQREASIALELVVKAVIAQQIELGVAQDHVTKVRHTHDVPALWRDAKLPSLTGQDPGRLLLVKTTLMWSGRYPAPKTDKEGAKDYAAIAEYYEVVATFGGGQSVKRPFSFEWDDFDRIFCIARDAFWDLRSYLP
ncbi:hypothetical protein V5F43_01495 [Xanthobacter agilis]|uniref:hypothetical protein n=1 Tax=Xanthobacter agilis TaxID=47492 RepID=UPI0037292D58